METSLKENEKLQGLKKRTIYPQHSYIPLQLSRMILQTIDCPYQIVDSHDQMYIKALNGNAKIQFKTGTLYQGRLRNGLMHGEGVITWDGNQTYSGLFVNNKIHGRGKFEFENGVYEGTFKNGMRQGFGVLRLGNGVYEGEWKKGKMHGEGKITFDDGEYYSGKFCQGIKQGEGEYHYQNQSVYKGNWVNNQRCGHGILQSKAQYYEGLWENDIPKGFGTIIWYEQGQSKRTVRNRYEGTVYNNIRQGHGAFFYSNLSVYVGAWQNNSKEGLGYFFNQNGEYTSGVYKNDRLDNCFTSTVPKSIRTTNGFDNTYGFMFDLNGLVSQNIVDQFNTICLRYNTKIKEWYRNFSEFSNQKYISYMQLSDLWRFLRSYKVLELGQSIPLFNRLLYSSRKTRNTLTSLPDSDFNFTINNVKTLEDFDNLYYVYQAKNTQSTLEQIQKNKPLENKKIDIHNGQQLVSYRSFVETLVRLVVKRASQQNKTATEKLTELFQRCIKKDSLCNRQSIDHSSCNSSVKSGFAEIIPDSSMLKFLSVCFDQLSNNYEQKFWSLDKTTTIQQVYCFLEVAKTESSVKYKISKFFLKNFFGHSEANPENIQKLLHIQLTFTQFKEFMLKWKSKYNFPTLNIMKHPEDWRCRVQSNKIQQKRKLQNHRKKIEEVKQQIQNRRKRQEQEKMLSFMVETVFKNDIDSDSYISGQSDF